MDKVDILLVITGLTLLLVILAWVGAISIA